jgi:phage terminase large subunit GpA-like protein
MLSSKASSEPGRWRTSRTPYLKAIMDCLSPTSPVERVVFMKGRRWARPRWAELDRLRDPPRPRSDDGGVADRGDGQAQLQAAHRSADRGIPAWPGAIAPARSRDSGNTILAKEFRGGVLVMTGANSAVGLRSMPVRYLFLDEVDGYPLDVEGEGDAISLAEARTRTFARRKIFIVSTPTIAGASAIEREFEASDQRRYFVPCPHCGHRQWLRFEQLRWERATAGDRGLHLRIL